MEKVKEEKVREKRNFNLLLFVTFLIGVILITATYAWFYASLNVRVNFFNIKVTDEKGLFISLDGINFGSTVEIDKDYSVLTNIDKLYIPLKYFLLPKYKTQLINLSNKFNLYIC